MPKRTERGQSSTSNLRALFFSALLSKCPSFATSLSGAFDAAALLVAVLRPAFFLCGDDTLFAVASSSTGAEVSPGFATTGELVRDTAFRRCLFAAELGSGRGTHDSSAALMRDFIAGWSPTGLVSPFSRFDAS